MLYIFSDIVNNGLFLGTLDVITSISIISAITIIALKNPIVSVLCLIILFFFVSGYLIFSGGTFLGLAYLLVYIGAVSILFLFILMLINIRVSELVTDTKNSIPLVLIVAILFKYANDILLFINTLQFDNWVNMGDVGNVSHWNWEDGMRTFGHAVAIGNILYTVFAILLIIVSIILLLAMVGAIAITATTGSSIQISKIKFLQSNIFKKFDSKKLKKLLMKTAIMFGLSISTKHIIAVYLDINVFVDYLNPVSVGYYFSIIIVKNYLDLYIWNKETINSIQYLPVPAGESTVFLSNSPSFDPDEMSSTGSTVVLGGTGNLGGTSPNQDTAMVDQNTTMPNQDTVMPNQNTVMADQNTTVSNQDTIVADQNTTMTDQGVTTSNPEIQTIALDSHPTDDLNTSSSPLSDSPPKELSSGEEYKEWLKTKAEKSARESEEFWSKIDTTETKRGKVYKVYTEGTGNNTVKYYRNEEGMVFTRPLYKHTPFVLRGEENRELRNAYREWEKAAGYNYITPLDSRNNDIVDVKLLGEPSTDSIIEDDTSSESEFNESGKSPVYEHNEDYRTSAWEAGLSEHDYNYYFGEISPPRSTVSSSMGPPSIPIQSTVARPSSSVHGIMGPPSYTIQSTVIGSNTNLNTGSRPNTEDNLRPSKKPRYEYTARLSNSMQGTIAGPSNTGQGRVITWPSNPTQGTIVEPNNTEQGRVTSGPSNPGYESDTRPTLPSVFGNIPGALSNNSGYVSNTSGYGNNRLVGNNSGSINPSYGSDPRPTLPSVFGNRPGEIGIRPNLPSIFGNRPGALFNIPNRRPEVYPSGDIGNLTSSATTRFTSDPSRYTSTPRGHVGNPSGSGSNSASSARNPDGSR